MAKAKSIEDNISDRDHKQTREQGYKSRGDVQVIRRGNEESQRHI